MIAHFGAFVNGFGKEIENGSDKKQNFGKKAQIGLLFFPVVL